jgi:hypothetical protein
MRWNMFSEYLGVASGMDYAPAPMIAIVVAPKAAETAEKVTMRTEVTTNTLISDQARDSAHFFSRLEPVKSLT